MINGKLSAREIRMTALGAAANPAQLMFGGTQHPSDKKVKLQLICTQIPD